MRKRKENWEMQPNTTRPIARPNENFAGLSYSINCCNPVDLHHKAGINLVCKECAQEGPNSTEL